MLFTYRKTLWTFPGYANFSPHDCAFAIVLFFCKAHEGKAL